MEMDDRLKDLETAGPPPAPSPQHLPSVQTTMQPVAPAPAAASAEQPDALPQRPSPKKVCRCAGVFVAAVALRVRLHCTGVISHHRPRGRGLGLIVLCSAHTLLPLFLQCCQTADAGGRGRLLVGWPPHDARRMPLVHAMGSAMPCRNSCPACSRRTADPKYVCAAADLALALAMVCPGYACFKLKTTRAMATRSVRDRSLRTAHRDSRCSTSATASTTVWTTRAATSARASSYVSREAAYR